MHSTSGAFAQEHDEFRSVFRRFLELEVRPAYAQWRKENRIPRSVFAIAGENGFLGISAPEAHGGSGVNDPFFGLVMIEETLRIGATGLGLLFVAHAQVAIPAIANFADDVDKQEWLPSLIAGHKIASISPSTSDGIQLRDIPGVGSVDVVLSAAPGGILLVPLAGKTIKLVPSPLGVEEACLGDVSLESLNPDHTSFGEDTAGRWLMSDWYLWLAALDLAAADTVLGLAVNYANEREVFGAALASFENTRVSLGRRAAKLDTVAAFALSLLRDRVSGPIDIARTAALRVSSRELHQQTVDQSLQLHGGYGYMREYPIAQAYADAGLVALLSPREPEMFVAAALGL